MTRTEMGNEQPTSTSILIRIVTYDYLSKKARDSRPAFCR